MTKRITSVPQKGSIKPFEDQMQKDPMVGNKVAITSKNWGAILWWWPAAFKCIYP